MRSSYSSSRDERDHYGGTSKGNRFDKETQRLSGTNPTKLFVADLSKDKKKQSSNNPFSVFKRKGGNAKSDKVSKKDALTSFALIKSKFSIKNPTPVLPKEPVSDSIDKLHQQE